MSQGNNELYEFDKFRLDVSERILWREGERVPLSERLLRRSKALALDSPVSGLEHLGCATAFTSGGKAEYFVLSSVDPAGFIAGVEYLL